MGLFLTLLDLDESANFQYKTKAWQKHKMTFLEQRKFSWTTLFVLPIFKSTSMHQWPTPGRFTLYPSTMDALLLPITDFQDQRLTSGAEYYPVVSNSTIK